MNKLKKTYLELKQKLFEHLGNERESFLILNAFLMSKLIKKEAVELVNLLGSTINQSQILELLEVCNQNIDSDLIFDLVQLSKVFEGTLDQKTHGIFYTDELLVNYINNNCIYVTMINYLPEKQKKKFFKRNPYINELIKENISIKELYFQFLKDLKIDEIVDVKNNINQMKFFDPTCGDGAFLMSVFTNILDTYININQLMNQSINYDDTIISILENNIYGNDIDTATTDFLKLKFLNNINKLNNNLSNKVLNIKFNLHNSNFLAYDKNIKFDCIVGNPPYFESKNLDTKGYKTEKINNIYAPILEKCTNLLNANGVMSMIVPISLISTPRMLSLREVLKESFNDLFISSFADRPASLFIKVHQKINIIIGFKNNSNEKNLYTSSYTYFNKDEFKDLFKKIKYIENTWDKDIAKYGNTIEKEIIIKNNNFKNNIFNYTVKESKHFILLNMRVGFWIKCFTKDNDSKEYKKIYFKTEQEKYIFMALLNSNIFYLYWTLLSDGWHITLKNLENFKFDLEQLTNEEKKQLVTIAKKLELDLEKNKEKIDSKQSEYEYKHKKSKQIIDEIDILLKNVYNFDENVVQYIKHHNLKYRMSTDYKEYMEKLNGI